MYFLPKDLQRHIFSFDSTYHDHYRIVMKQLNTYGSLKRNRNGTYSSCLKKSDLVGSYVVSFSNSKQQLF